VKTGTKGGACLESKSKQQKRILLDRSKPSQMLAERSNGKTTRKRKSIGASLATQQQQ
jgi:hypothetical protein